MAEGAQLQHHAEKAHVRPNRFQVVLVNKQDRQLARSRRAAGGRHDAAACGTGHALATTKQRATVGKARRVRVQQGVPEQRQRNQCEQPAMLSQ